MHRLLVALSRTKNGLAVVADCSIIVSKKKADHVDEGAQEEPDNEADGEADEVADEGDAIPQHYGFRNLNRVFQYFENSDIRVHPLEATDLELQESAASSCLHYVDFGEVREQWLEEGPCTNCDEVHPFFSMLLRTGVI